MNTTTAQDLTAAIDQSIQALAAETDAARQNEAFRLWLTTMSRFYSYSFGNQMLIAFQRPTASHVAGFRRWQSMNRFVRKGEKGIRILAPIIRRKEEETTKDGKTSRIAGFRVASVFDIAQTDGEPLPEAPEHDATTGSEDLLPKVEAGIRACGIELVYKAIAGGVQGLSRGGTIEIEQEQTISAKCGTAVHEWAHEQLHKNNRGQGKQQRELEAEAVAFAVLTHYGMQPGSQFYLASYGITGEMLSATMQTISTTARQIIERIEGGAAKDEEEAGDVGLQADQAA